MATVTIAGRATPPVPGKSLFTYADELGVRVPSSCPRDGSCRECIVEVTEGADALSERTGLESFLSGGFRLACQARTCAAAGNIVVNVLRRERQIVAEGTQARTEEWELAPLTCREGDRVKREGEDLGAYRGRLYGIAADIGTTTVVLTLMDLETGDAVATVSFENPQTFGGSDVMHRIKYDGDHPGELRRILVAFVNAEIERMPCDSEDIYEFVVVGNPTMRDVFFGLDVQTIGQRPFKSLTEHELDQGKSETTAFYRSQDTTGLRMNVAGVAYAAPLIACHVGADAAACVLASRLHRSEHPFMLMDIGTNTEVILGSRDRIVCASCAAGPAFEGGRIKYGMPGIEGAIESVVLQNGHVEVRTIGEVEPQGICGSGLIDLIAELVRNEHVNNMGRFVGDTKEFSLDASGRLTFAEPDIQELAQAKGATFAGTMLALKNYPLSLEELPQLQLAGGFAQYINVANANLIGLIPDLAAERVVKVGNLAAEGARELLLSANKRRELEQVTRNVDHIELESDPDFFTLFVEGCTFG